MTKRIYVLPAIRVTAEERAAVLHEAQARGMTVSEWVRHAATQKLSAEDVAAVNTAHELVMEGRAPTPPLSPRVHHPRCTCPLCWS